jgi:signal recognition particle subunit SRP54
VFDTLSDRLQATLGDLGRAKRLDEDAVNKAMREIRLALLEADVNFQVVKDFVAGVKAEALGDDILKGLNAGQQVVKLVHDRLAELMGTGDSQLAFGRPPTVILMTGLQGAGKTTMSAKLALHLRRDGRKPGLVAADLQRPAAIDQLEQLGKQIAIPVYRTETKDPVVAATEGLERAKADGLDVVIVDTAGRLNVDEALMDELARVRDAVKPLNILLILDAMTGQEAVNVAEAFQEHISFDGVVLTKLDGDARGGAALSVKAITGKPIKFASVGEKLDQLEVFHPDRMASRILGMGDVLTLIERAEQATSADEAARMEAQLRKGQFTFDDFLQAQKMLRRMGPLAGVMKMLPGMGQLADMDVDESKLTRVEAIVLSMTPRERSVPHSIDGHRRLRIANGSGTSVQEVNQLLEARKMMEKMMGQMGKGKMPALPGLGDLGGMPGGMPGGPPGVAPLSRRTPPKKRKGGKKRSGRR